MLVFMFKNSAIYGHYERISNLSADASWQYLTKNRKLKQNLMLITA